MRLSVSARRALDPCWSTSSSSGASEAGMLIPHRATDITSPGQLACKSGMESQAKLGYPIVSGRAHARGGLFAEAASAAPRIRLYPLRQQQKSLCLAGPAFGYLI